MVGHVATRSGMTTPVPITRARKDIRRVDSGPEGVQLWALPYVCPDATPHSSTGPQHRWLRVRTSPDEAKRPRSLGSLGPDFASG